ncbi:MAG TPA: hypothetical protein VFG84_06750 [Gemmatimonadaceae bacterium]|nr:hypothetical protein [Gemmatimonadaceae bacterium]
MPGNLGDDEVRQFTREYRNRLESARELQRELRELGLDTGDLERTIEQMRGLGAPGTYEDMAEVERLQSQVIEGLKAFEFALRRQLGAGTESMPVLGGNSDVPAEFKALVEEYYRSLARKGRP